jgi:hypothetical protein
MVVNQLKKLLARRKAARKLGGPKVRKATVKRATKTAKKPSPKARAQPSTKAATIMQALDARALAHVPPPIPCSPYTVIRSRTQLSVTTSSNVAGGNYLVLTFGAHTDNSLGTGGGNITPTICIRGHGVNLPSVTEDVTNDPIMVNYGYTAANSSVSAGLHSMTVVITCVESAMNASGQVFTGALNNRLARSAYPSWNSLALTMLTRRELKPRSAYQTMQAPVVLQTAPLDVTDWSLFKPVVAPPPTSSNNHTTDTITPLVAVFSPTSTALEYSVTIYCEWRCLFLDPLLSCTHVPHQPSTMDFWSQASNFMGTVAGDVNTAAGMVNNVASAIGGTMNAASSIALGLSKLR